MKNLLSIPFHEEGNNVFTGEKENTQLALSSSKSFYTFVRSEREKQKQFFCFEALTTGHNSSVLSYRGETGDRDIFSAFVFWSLLQ